MAGNGNGNGDPPVVAGGDLLASIDRDLLATMTGRSLNETAADLAAAAVSGVLADLAQLGARGQRGVVVDSPPGAGKSSLVARATAELAAAGERVMVVAQTNGQVDDLVDRLATAAGGMSAAGGQAGAGGLPGDSGMSAAWGRAADRGLVAVHGLPAVGGLSIGRLCGHEYRPTSRATRHPTVRIAQQVGDLADCPVIAATAAKWATVGDGTWPWAVIDEAYQMRSDLLLRIGCRFDRALFVGDPGQLDPFSTVQIDRWAGLTWDPLQSAVAVLLRNNPDIPVRRLPVSWRLPASAAPLVAEAFYPFTGFRAGTDPGQRRLEFSTSAFGTRAPGAGVFGMRALGVDPVDEAVETAAASGWALYELPARQSVRTDGEAVAACAALAERILQRGAVSYSERGPAGDGRPVTADRIAIGTAHRDQAQAIRSLLSPQSGVTVDTANRLQGREFDVTIVLHPLSGRRDATAFHLEAGRLCVLASRHRHACIVVARAGIPELLDAHPSTEPVHLNVPAKFPDGWEANQAVMAHLAGRRVRAR